MSVCLRNLFLVLILISAGETFAAQNRKDTITLYHNEIITGEIKEMRLGLLTIDTKNVSIINIKASKIQSINTATDTFRIETADQMVYFAALRPAPKDGYVYITSPHYVRLIAISHINLMTPIERSFGNGLQGNVSAGFNYTHSNGIGQLNGSANIYYTTKRVIINLNGSTNASIDTSTFSLDRTDLGITGYYSLQHNSKWYLLGQLDYQRNLQLSIARRYQQIVGGGRKFVITPSTQIMSMLGASLNQELSTAGSKDVLVEIPLGFIFNFFKFSSPNMQITSQNVFYTSLSQKGRVRYDMNTDISWELIDNFYISWTFYYSYDRQPPDPDSGKSDYGTVISLSYKF